MSSTRSIEWETTTMLHTEQQQNSIARNIVDNKEEKENKTRRDRVLQTHYTLRSIDVAQHSAGIYVAILLFSRFFFYFS